LNSFDAGWALLLLPLAGVGVSYLAETRRGAALGVLVFSVLTLVAALVMLGTTVASLPTLHQSTLTFWTFSVTQSPFNAATKTLLSPNFQVGFGFAASPVATALALAVVLVVLLGQLQMWVQLRGDVRLATLTRLTSLLSFGAILLIMAQGLFQVLVGFELCGLFSALLIGSALGTGAGAAARRAYLVWRAGALSLLLATVFIYVKFSGAIEVAATAHAKHGVTPNPYGLNLTALNSIWIATNQGLAHGVGGRSMTLAAVLILVAAGCACGQLPLHGLWRGLAGAPGATASIVVSVAGLAIGTSLLDQSFTLLRLASAVLPALVVLGGLSSLVTAVLALRATSLRRFGALSGASLAGAILVGFGLGTPAGAIALAVAAVLTIGSLTAVTAHLGRDLRVDDLDKLGPAWRQARPTMEVLLLALAATAGVVGAGTFFGRAAVLGAAFGGVASGLKPATHLFALLGGGGELLASAVLAAACTRVALAALRGADPNDPRELRATRRTLSRAKDAGQLPLLRAGVALALVSGLVSLPAIHLGLGSFLAPHKGATAIPLEWWALLLTLIVPLIGIGAGFLLGAPRKRTSSASVWESIADGTALLSGGERTLLGGPGAGAELATRKVWGPLADRAGTGLQWLLEFSEGEQSWLPAWSARSGVAVLAMVVIAVAIVTWVRLA
jgi:NADH:ubiquinone oxidoreductase subunit 5 (subunit L)/multisubunit Na+/H+ antiporter MnhA subunit